MCQYAKQDVINLSILFVSDFFQVPHTLSVWGSSALAESFICLYGFFYSKIAIVCCLKEKTEVAATNIIATIAATDEDDDDKEVVDIK